MLSSGVISSVNGQPPWTITKFVFPQLRIVENRFEPQRIGPADVEVASGAAEAMDVNSHAQPAAFRGYVPEQIILQQL